MLVFSHQCGIFWEESMLVFSLFLEASMLVFSLFFGGIDASIFLEHRRWYFFGGINASAKYNHFFGGIDAKSGNCLAKHGTKMPKI